MAKIGEIRTYVNSVCGTQVGYYPVSAAATLNAAVAEVETTLQTTMTAAEREAQVTTLQTAFTTFKNGLSAQTINQPLTSSDGDAHYYTLCTPLRGSRYATSSGSGSELAGATAITTAACWKFVAHGDGKYDIVNIADASFISPNSSNNTALKTQTTAPTAGWTVSKSDEPGFVIITSGSCQFNQTNMASTALSGAYKIYNWGSGSNISDTGCKYVISEIAEEDIPYPLSSTPLPELKDKEILVAATAADDLTTGQWYVMYDRGATRGYLFENVQTHKLHNTATKPSGATTLTARHLVRLMEAYAGKMYIQTGFGNYFGKIQQSTPVPVTARPVEPLTIAKINNTAGHFFVQSAEGIIMDANDYSLGDDKATVVGWGNKPPTATGGNNDWAFFPVSLTGDAPSHDGIRLTPTDEAESSRFNDQSSKIHNLAGQQLNKPMKGVNIINGKKAIVR